KDKLYFGEDAAKRLKSNPECGIKLFKRMLNTPNESKKVMYKNISNTKEEKITKSYVIDTNVFINIPNILDRLSKDEKAILSVTVLEELEYRCKDLNTKYTAENAINNINKHLNGNIEFIKSDTNVLPKDFFIQRGSINDQNDNKILSIAKICKDRNEKITLITDDKGLQNKASSIDIEYINYEEFKVYNNLVVSESDEYIELTGQKASSIFLEFLRIEASKKLEIDIKKAVITVPANFNQVEIESTKKAVLDAGFEDIKILKEPVAAAIIYGLDSNTNQNILVYDFGGGTFDISIININESGNMEVIRTGGDSKLGGEDITNQIQEYIYEKLEDDHDLCMFDKDDSDLTNEQFTYNEQKINEKAEQLKIALSEFEEQSVSLINIYVSKDEQKTIEYTFTREEIEDEVLRSIDGKVNQKVKNCIKGADLLSDDIDVIALAGGTSSIPLFQEGILKTLAKKPNTTKNLATIVADGAAIKSEIIWGDKEKSTIVKDSVIHDFGVKLHDTTFDKLISAGSKLPAFAKKVYVPSAENPTKLNIEVFLRERESKATKTIHPGIEFLDSISIDNLPNEKLKLEIIFEIDTEYTLHLDANILDYDNNPIKNSNLKIERASKMI
ncbi:MAG: Hsp70 family protein, partial [Peptostreptococcaceae bacterium]